MLALLRHDSEQPTTDRSGSPESSIFVVPTTPTAKVAMMHLTTDAPSPSHKDSDRPFQCHEPGCGRRFNRKFTLSEHIKTHTGEKPYVCPVSTCSKRFSTSGNLARHKRLHASIKPFECTIDNCKRSFPNELKLQQHLKIHLGGKTHMCKAAGCGKSFSTAGNLTRHMKNHHMGSSRGDDSHQYRSMMGPVGGMPHGLASHSPVSVASNDHHHMYTPGRHMPLTAYAAHSGNPAPHGLFTHAQPSQPSMANLYYSFNQGSVHEPPVHHHTNQHHSHHQQQQQHPQPHMQAASTFPQHSFHQPMYEDVHSVHPLHPHDGASLNLFDDVIEFQLGHPRMI